jgi:hypothetical protein
MTVTVAEIADEMSSRGMENPILPFLDLQPHYVRILMFQPCGTIVADDNAVRVREPAALTAQMKNFLFSARQLDVDVAACPEYSCPWEALCESIESGILPGEGRLWAVACASATSAEFELVRTRLSNHLVVIFDEAMITSAGNFVDVVCYLFKTRRSDGSVAAVSVFQGKTHEMGGTDYERSFLKRGSRLYRFRNTATGSNSLITLLCSDSLDQSVNARISELHGQSCTILHLQLNPKPADTVYRAYRTHCCTIVPRTTQILCLNWAKGTMILENSIEKLLIEEPGTILFRSVDELDAGDTRIVDNHTRGCYLTYMSSQKTAAFVFSPDSQLLYFEMTKPLVAGPGPNARRTGPRMIDTFTWDAPASAWTARLGPCNDRFKAAWLDKYQPLAQYLDPIFPQIVDLERVIYFAIGRGTSFNWAHWTSLKSFELAEDETAQRLTLCWADHGAGHDYRTSCLKLFRGFTAILGNPAQFSARLAEFKSVAFELAYKTQTYRRFRNLHAESGSSATAVYLGSTPTETELNEFRSKIIAGLLDTGADPEIMAIWFRDEHGMLHDYMNKHVPQITSDPADNPVSCASAQR